MFHLELIFETTNATAEASISVIRTAGTVTRSELRKKRHISDWFHASTKFCSVRLWASET